MTEAQKNAIMKRLTVDMPKDNHVMLKVEAASNETLDMKGIIMEAVGAWFWERGKHFPGYEPDECHLCSYPISQHTERAATATEPASLECPIDQEIPY